MNAETLMMAGGIVVFIVTIMLVRRRVLREKYALYWISLASALLLVGLLPILLKRTAELAHLSYPAAVLCLALVLGYPFAFGVSVSLSRQYQHTRRLAQELALLRERLERLERTHEHKES